MCRGCVIPRLRCSTMQRATLAVQGGSVQKAVHFAVYFSGRRIGARRPHSAMRRFAARQVRQRFQRRGLVADDRVAVPTQGQIDVGMASKILRLLRMDAAAGQIRNERVP